MNHQAIRNLTIEPPAGSDPGVYRYEIDKEGNVNLVPQVQIDSPPSQTVVQVNTSGIEHHLQDVSDKFTVLVVLGAVLVALLLVHVLIAGSRVQYARETRDALRYLARIFDEAEEDEDCTCCEVHGHAKESS